MGIDRRILRLAFPAIVSNITVPLLGLCDTTIAGHIGTPAYIGAVAVGAMMLNVIFWLCGFLRMGTTGLAAIANGKGNGAMSADILRKSLTIAAAVSILVLALQVPLRNLLLELISPERESRAFALTYFNICIWGAPAQLAIMAISGWYIGMQNTVVPMAVAISANILNIALSLTAVFALHLGFAGIALGTLCANWAGALAIGILAALRLKRMRHLSASHDLNGLKSTPSSATAEIGKVRWSRFFSVNSDLFLRSACIMAVTMAVTAVGARLGELTLAANAVMMQFFIFFSYFMDGFAFAGEAMTGHAVGASDRRALRACVRHLMYWGAAMAALFTVVYLIFTLPIASLITPSRSVTDIVAGMKPWVVALPPLTVSAFIFDGIYIGMTRTRPLLVSTLISALIFFAVTYLGGAPSNPRLWTAFETYLFSRGALLAGYYWKLRGKLII